MGFPTKSPAKTQSQVPQANVVNFSTMRGKVARLRPDCETYHNIETAFLRPIRKQDPDARVIKIHRCKHSSDRLMMHRLALGAVTTLRGGANEWHAWYGTEAAGVSRIMAEGFGRAYVQRYLGDYGIGLQLWYKGCSNMGTFYSKRDATGKHHVLLCQVILGSMEQIQKSQSRPNRENFDSAVDDLEQPRRLSHMEYPHELPCPPGIHRIRISDDLEGLWRKMHIAQAFFAVQSRPGTSGGVVARSISARPSFQQVLQQAFAHPLTRRERANLFPRLLSALQDDSYCPTHDSLIASILSNH